MPLRGVFNAFLEKHLSFAQEGEDKILWNLLEKKAKGFYIDIGAYRPIRFSNTYLFYLQGWRGLNIDANPQGIQRFRWVRPRDVNVMAVVGNAEIERSFYEFNESALNTLDAQRAEFLNATTKYRQLKRRSVTPIELKTLLQEHLAENQKIDFLSIDVEGAELEVLRTSDWDKFTPRFIVAEDLSASDLTHTMTTPLASYLSSLGYVPIAKTPRSVFFKKT